MEKSMDHQMDTCVTNLLNEGVEKGVLPGAAAALSWSCGSGRTEIFSVAGSKDSRYSEELITRNTFFDLASLTKPLSTTLLIYSLINEKSITLSTTLSDIFHKKIPEDKQTITVGQLLSHSSGMVSYKHFFKAFSPVISEKNKEILFYNIVDEPLEYPPESTCQYSDLGFILLGHVVEQVTGISLRENFTERITIPIGLEKEIFYNPVIGSRSDPENFAATEDCPWRGRIMRAEVHDEHCWLMNGVAGHAGLFGTVGGVLSLCESILDSWLGRENSYCWSAMVARGLQKQYPDQTWCLGFDTPSLHGSSGGKYLSPSSVGHLGYAGTSFWIDPEKELIIVLLTNRVNPSRENNRIRQFRPYFHDSVIETLQKETGMK
jgi:CubicO group peptidase (beta-lactamase class C family)